MKTEWTQRTWGEICQLHYGKSLKDYRNGVGDTEVFGTNGPIGWTQQAPLAHGPNPIVGRKGAYRGVHLANGPFWVIDTAYWLEAAAELDPVWAYYNLKSIDINGMDSGSAIPSLTRDHFYALPVRLPPLDEQRRIAGILGALDDLIEVNRRLIGNCEELARNLAGQASRQVPLSQIAVRADLRTVRPEGSIDLYSLPAYDNNREPERIDGSSVKSNKQALDDSCVLVARLNPHIPRVWMAYPRAGATSLASTEFVPLRGEDVPNEVVYAACSSPSYLNQMNELVTGTTGSHQRVDKDAITSALVVDARTLSDSAIHTISMLIQQAHALRSENAELASTRDELLPLLMSGRVRVGDVAA